jgi:hypothetical protein
LSPLHYWMYLFHAITRTPRLSHSAVSFVSYTVHIHTLIRIHSFNPFNFPHLVVALAIPCCFIRLLNKPRLTFPTISILDCGLAVQTSVLSDRDLETGLMLRVGERGRWRSVWGRILSSRFADRSRVQRIKGSDMRESNPKPPVRDYLIGDPSEWLSLQSDGPTKARTLRQTVKGCSRGRVNQHGNNTLRLTSRSKIGSGGTRVVGCDGESMMD